MARSKTIGKVSVKVYPDTKEFKQRLRQQLAQAERDKALSFQAQLDERSLYHSALYAIRDVNNRLSASPRYEIKFKTGLDESGVWNDVKRVRRNMQARADAYTKVNPVRFKTAAIDAPVIASLDIKNLQSVRNRLHAWAAGMSPIEVEIRPVLKGSTTQFIARRLDSLAKPRNVDFEIFRNNPDAVRQVANLAGALSGLRAAMGAGREVGDFLKNIDRAVPALGAAALAAANLASVSGTAVANTLALGGSLAKIAPAALVLPGVLGGMAVGLGATVAAFGDFNDEVPAAEKAMGDLQDSISEEFWAKAGSSVRGFVDELAPLFTANGGRTGSALGGFFASLADDLRGSFGGSITTMFDNLNESIRIATGYTNDFAGIITTLGTVGSRALPDLARWFGEISDDFNAFIADAEASGELQRWIDEGIDGLKDLGSIAKDSGRTLAALSRAASNSGGSTLDSMAEGMERIADSVSAPGFQRDLTRVFRNMREGVGEISGAAGDDFKEFIESLGDLSDSTLPSAGRTLGTALEAILGALSQDRVTDSIAGLFERLESAVGRLAPVMDDVAVKGAAVVDVVGAVADNAAKVLAPAIEATVPFIDALSEGAVDLADGLGGLAGGVLEGVAGGVDALGGGLGDMNGTALLAGAALFAMRNQIRTGGAAIEKGAANVKTWAQQTKAATPTIRQFGQAAYSAGIPMSQLMKQTQSTSQAVARSSAQMIHSRAVVANYGAQIGIAAKRMAPAAAGAAGLALAMSGAADSMGLSNTASLAMMGTMAGPWGAAVGAGIGLILDFSKANSAASDSIKQVDAAIANSNSFAVYGQQLAQMEVQMETLRDNAASSPGGWMDALGTYFGDDFEWDKIQGQIDKVKAAQTEISATAQLLAQSTNMRGSLGQMLGIGDNEANTAEILDRIAPAMQRLGISMQDLGTMDTSAFQQLLAEVNKAGSGQAAMETLESAIRGLGDESLTSSQKASNLKLALDGLLNPAINAEQGAIRYRSALQSLGAQFDNTGRLTDQNKQALIGATTSLTGFLTSMDNPSPEKLTNALMRGIDQITRTGTAAGLSEGEVRGYLTTLGLTPDVVDTIIRTSGVGAARTAMRDLLAAYKLNPKQVTTVMELIGAKGARAAAKELADTYGLTPEQIKTIVTITGIKDSEDQAAALREEVEKIGGTKEEAKVGVEGTDQGAANVQRMIDQITGSMTNLNSSAVGLGSDFSSGYASGIAAGADDAYNAAFAVAQAAAAGTAAGQDSNSPSKVAAALGVDFTSGYALGITSRTGAVVTAVTGVVYKAVKAVTDALANGGFGNINLEKLFDTDKWLDKVQEWGSKAAGAFDEAWDKQSGYVEEHARNVESLREDWKRANKDVAQSALDVKDAEKDLARARQDLRDADSAEERKNARRRVADAEETLRRARKEHEENVKNRKAIRKALEDEKELLKISRAKLENLKKNKPYYNKASAAIQDMVEKYEDVNTQLQEAQGNLESVISQMDSYKASLKDSYTATASILNAPFATAKSIFGWMDDSIASLTDFNDGLAALMKLGIPQSVIDDLAQAGPEAQKFVDALMGMSPEEIKKFIEQWNKIEGLAGGIGENVGNYVFGDELIKAQTEVKNLLKLLEEMQKPIQDATNALMSAIAKGTKVNVDSSVAAIDKLIDKYAELTDAANAMTDTTIPGVPTTGNTAAILAARAPAVAPSNATTVQIDSISIPVSDLDQIRTIQDFIDMLRVSSRQGSV